MSISAALSNAVSGLAATARATEIVSTNVANAMTPGYGRRELMISSSSLSGGVQVDGIMRSVNARVLGDHRIAAADQGNSSTLAQFWTSMENVTGVAGDGDSLSDRFSALEASLISASSRPDNDTRLDTVARSAADAAGKLNEIGSAIADARTGAESAISADVDRLNAALAEVAKLNRAITIETANGRDSAALQDERQKAIDSIASIVPVREVPRENGRIALFTTGGATLLDGATPVQIDFNRTGYVQPGMSVGTPPMERLIIGGEELDERQMQFVAGGSLAAQFQIRDDLAPKMQAQVDAAARDLYERFADPAVDDTLTAGQPGLFTDDGAAFTAANEVGLANRLRIAAAVDPAGTNEAWRLRDGLNAASPGDPGRTTLLTEMAKTLQTPRVTSSSAVSPGSRSAAGFAAELSAHASTRRLRSDEVHAHATARRDSLEMEMMRDGVDTDREMERLLQLENAYAANARVISAADAMIATILEL